ncbi:disulfide bond formation protein B [Candidatus Spongiihabitans sp.]|uniref:disulfide bond formation protein B n=1 Tax=Candidatus Spongiihabitans sp. TaxID=3101308 RepID=UPI003C7C1274
MATPSFSTRTLACIGFIACASLIAIALYFQHIESLDPCPLCIFQRVAFIGMGVVFLATFLHNPASAGRRLYGLLAAVFGVLGLGIAARHVWLQSLPAHQVPECGPGLDYMLEVFPLRKMLETVFKGSGECAEVSWTWFGISMPGWSLIWLAILTALALMLMSRKS